ncbi:hypothetical protein [Aquimarina algicola]|uniref:Uncharacterized protein n=1 Tax=Aquimarina algicola TaxID=2589995 RepID=A0A504J0Z8_9FLAO|nr:hypothetical protein [Aquimarina algicola]TPN82102.1 hypothetical protein FHK87_21995 [Aquimarina algicola]
MSATVIISKLMGTKTFGVLLKFKYSIVSEKGMRGLTYIKNSLSKKVAKNTTIKDAIQKNRYVFLICFTQPK